MCERTWRLIGSVFWTGLAALSVLAFGSAAFAAGGRPSETHKQAQEKAARKACLVGDVSTGLSILADMFVEHKNAVYVFNQGRCLEQNSRYKEAISRFEEYVRLGDTMKLVEGGPAIAKKHIEDCKAKLFEEEQHQAAAARPVVQPPAVAQPILPPVPEPEATPPIALAARPQPEPAQGGKGLLIGGIVTSSLGVGAEVAGVLLGRKSNTMIDEMQGKPGDYTPSKHSSQQTYKTLAWVGYGVGAACLAGGAVLIAVGASRRASSSQTEVALVPALAPGQAGVLLSGGF